MVALGAALCGAYALGRKRRDDVATARVETLLNSEGSARYLREMERARTEQWRVALDAAKPGVEQTMRLAQRIVEDPGSVVWREMQDPSEVVRVQVRLAAVPDPEPETKG